jgi:hypothetical protein
MMLRFKPFHARPLPLVRGPIGCCNRNAKLRRHTNTLNDPCHVADTPNASTRAALSTVTRFAGHVDRPFLPSGNATFNAVHNLVAGADAHQVVHGAPVTGMSTAPNGLPS